MPVGSAAISRTFLATTPSDRQIVFNRLFDASRRLVFDAMTKPRAVFDHLPLLAGIPLAGGLELFREASRTVSS